MASPAKPPSDLPQLVAALNAKMNIAMAVGAAAITAAGFVAWSMMGQLTEINRSLGRAEGAITAQGTSMQSQLQDIARTLQAIEANQAPPQPDQRSEIKPGWRGVRADNAGDLGKALAAVPDSAGPIWLYTPDAGSAALIGKALGQ